MEMSYGYLKTTRLTGTRAKIALPYFVDTKSNLFKTYKYLHPGINVYCTQVQSFCCGVVVAIGVEPDDKHLAVSVQYNAHTLVRYKHLRSATAKLGQPIKQSEPIGVADKYVNFEYCKTAPFSRYPVRVAGIQYYKQDPNDILDDNESLPMTNLTLVVNGDDIDEDDADFVFEFESSAQEEEFGDNSGGVKLMKTHGE